MCFGWTVVSCGADLNGGGKCGMTFAVPDSYYRALRQNVGGNRGPLFSCPQGHRISYELAPDPRDTRIQSLEAEKARAIQEAKQIQVQAKKEILEAQTAAAKAEDARHRCLGVVQETDCWRGYCPTCPAKQPNGSKNKSGARAWRKNHLAAKHGDRKVQ